MDLEDYDVTIQSELNRWNTRSIEKWKFNHLPVIGSNIYFDYNEFTVKKIVYNLDQLSITIEVE